MINPHCTIYKMKDVRELTSLISHITEIIRGGDKPWESPTHDFTGTLSNLKDTRDTMLRFNYESIHIPLRTDLIDVFKIEEWTMRRRRR